MMHEKRRLIALILDGLWCDSDALSETRAPRYVVPSMVAELARFRGGFEQELIRPRERTIEGKYGARNFA
jgi:hypothetical protein